MIIRMSNLMQSCVFSGKSCSYCLWCVDIKTNRLCYLLLASVKERVNCWRAWLNVCQLKGKTVSIDNSAERSPVCIFGMNSFVFIDKRV